MGWGGVVEMRVRSGGGARRQRGPARLICSKRAMRRARLQCAQWRGELSMESQGPAELSASRGRSSGAEYRVALLPDHAQMHSPTAGLSSRLKSERKRLHVWRGKKEKVSESRRAFTNFHFLKLCLFLLTYSSLSPSLLLSVLESGG